MGCIIVTITIYQPIAYMYQETFSFVMSYGMYASKHFQLCDVIWHICIKRLSALWSHMAYMHQETFSFVMSCGIYASRDFQLCDLIWHICIKRLSALWCHVAYMHQETFSFVISYPAMSLGDRIYVSRKGGTGTTSIAWKALGWSRVGHFSCFKCKRTYVENSPLSFYSLQFQYWMPIFLLERVRIAQESWLNTC